MAKFVVLFSFFAVAFASSNLLGGVEKVDKKDPELLKALEYAMDLYNARSNNLYREMATKVIEATKQLVAGEKFCIVTVVGTSRSCRNDDKHKAASLEDCPVDQLDMVCRFEVLFAPWQKNPEDLLSHDCVGLNEKRKLSCHQDVPMNDEENMVKHVEVKEDSKVKDEEKQSSKDTELEQRRQFHDFMKKYKKLYKPSEKEYEYRFKVFQENLVKAKKMQEMDMGTAKYGVTQFSDLSYEEFKSMYAMPGWGKPEEELKQADIPTGDIPDSFDWRTKGVVTPVKNQGQCGSCWAFSTTGNVEGQWAIKKGKLISLSEQELVDCDKVDSGCEGGLPANAYKQIEKLGGLETEQEYPYSARDGQCKFEKSDVKVKINGSVAISSNEGDMAAWLAKNGPISIGINAMAMQFYMGGVAHPWKIFCNPSSLDHGVLIVGYGVKNGWFGKTPYWIIKNSWGASWGVQGYYLIYRGDGSCGLNTACTSAVVD